MEEEMKLLRVEMENRMDGMEDDGMEEKNLKGIIDDREGYGREDKNGTGKGRGDGRGEWKQDGAKNKGLKYGSSHVNIQKKK